MLTTVMITIPACFRFHLREQGNIVCQLATPAWKGDGLLEPLSGGRARGFLVKPADGTSEVLVLTNSSQPPAAYPFVLRLRESGIGIDASKDLDLSNAKWVRHPQQVTAWSDLVDFERNTESVCKSWDKAFHYKREDVLGGIDGLRPPQIGAVYAVQAHWTVNSDPATIVLPTGVGKTETMLSVLVGEKCERLLIVVPTDALRTQLFDKFLTLGLLKTQRFQVISDQAMYPVVGRLSHGLVDAVGLESFVKKCNVIVTTMALAIGFSKEMRMRLTDLCPTLFIDEAHHVGAPRWNEFRDSFQRSRIVQFTATPFRNDNKPIGGRRIFTFSLKQAQEQGYFKPIVFKPVMEFDPARKDAAIAEAAVGQLRLDSDKGHTSSDFNLWEFLRGFQELPEESGKESALRFLEVVTEPCSFTLA